MSLMERVVDGAVSLVNPRAGAMREAFRGIKESKAFKRSVARVKNSGFYRGRRKGNSLGGWNTRETAANEDLKYSLEDLRNDSNDLVLNNAIGGGAIDTFVTNVVGTGLTLNSIIDHEYLGMEEEAAQEWQEKAEREFKLFSKSCDLTRTRSFVALQELVFRSHLVDGDIFVNLPMIQRKGVVYKTALNLIEGRRIKTPTGKLDNDRLAMGVELDINGCPSKYHYLKSGGKGVSQQFGELKAFDSNGDPLVLHVFRKNRVNQNRGIPLLSRIIELVKKIDTYSQAEVDAAVINAFFTVFVKKKAFEEDADDPINFVSSSSNETNSKPEDPVKLESGNVIELLDDEEGVEFADPKRPNVNFDAFFKAVVSEIAVGLNIPYEVLMKTFQSSYSASKGAIIEATKVFDQYERFLIDIFCQPVYETFLAEAVQMNRLVAPGFFTDPLVKQAYCGSEWIGPAQNELDPLKAAKAAKARIDTGISNEIIETSKSGRNYEQVAKGASRVNRIKTKFNLNDEPEAGK